MRVRQVYKFLADTPPSDRRHALRRLGFEYINGGGFKEVYGANNVAFVVKLHTPGGAGCNERANMKTCPPAISAHVTLARVVQGDGFQIQKYYPMRECPPTCDGYVKGVWDSDRRNHTHDETGRTVLYDYGQTDQWDHLYFTEQEKVA